MMIGTLPLIHPLAPLAPGQPIGTIATGSHVAIQVSPQPGSGIYYDNTEVPMAFNTMIHHDDNTNTNTNMRKRSRVVEPALLQGKAMLPAPALFNAFEQLPKKRCVSPVIVESVKCLGVNHNNNGIQRSVGSAINTNTLHNINYNLSVAPLLPDIAREEQEDVGGCREAALALSSLCCPRQPRTQPLAPSISTIQSYNHATISTLSAPPTLRWTKPAKPLD